MIPTALTDDEIEAFHRDGFVIRRSLFTAAEASLMSQALAQDTAIQDRAYGLEDGHGGATVVAVWNQPSDDTLGVVPRLPRIAGNVANLLNGEVYHYHSKITSKAGGGGGTWDWHQDYGYWYKNGCLFPDMASVAIAVSEQTEQNGALRLMRGSQRCGRLEHFIYGGQSGADIDRVKELERRLETVTFEADPGDAVFFHSNTLHSSSPNTSDSSRDVLLCCFNAASNDPMIEHHHPGYTPLSMVDDDTLITTGLVLDGDHRTFMNPADDISIGEFVDATK